MPIASKRGGVDERASLFPPEILPLIHDSFVRSCDLFEEYVFRLALDVFRRLGLAAACAKPATTAEAIARAGLDPRQATVPLDWILRKLVRHGVLEADPDAGEARYRLSGELPKLDAESVRLAQERHDPRALPSYTIAALAGEHYSAVLRGETTGERVLFGADRMAVWEEYFANDNVIYALNNSIGAIACEAAFPPGDGAILELGGGLGSGTWALLDRFALKGRSAPTYRFTELSVPFLRRAQRALCARFPEVALSFARLDMNRPFAEAGVAPGSYALVHAVNAVHVARDLAFTLGEIREALREGGTLVVAECVRPLPGDPVHAEFVFNLLEAFREPVLVPGWRPNGGFLTPEQWTLALEANGFTDVRSFPDIASIRDAYPAFVVAAIVAVRA